jgi:hypothetical protein
MSLSPRDFEAQWITRPLEDKYVHFVKPNDNALQEVVKLCHRLVTDRDSTFTEMNRQRLYERWLSSRQPCIMAMTDGDRELVGASVVLPLKIDAYHKYCSAQLDAIEIENWHLCPLGDSATHRFLLIDIAAIDRKIVDELIREKKLPFRGLWIRGLIRHIARFYDGRKEPRPILLGSTFNKELARAVRSLSFYYDGAREKVGAPVYRFNFAHLTNQYLFPSITEYYREVIKMLQFYNKGITKKHP